MSARDAKTWRPEAGLGPGDLEDEWDALEALRFAREDTESTAPPVRHVPSAAPPAPAPPDSVTARIEEATLRARVIPPLPAVVPASSVAARPGEVAPGPATLPTAEDITRDSLVSVPPTVGSIPPPLPVLPLPSAGSSLEAFLVAAPTLDGRPAPSITTPDFSPFAPLVARLRALGSRTGIVIAAFAMLVAIPCGHFLGRGLALPPRAATTLQATAAPGAEEPSSPPGAGATPSGALPDAVLPAASAVAPAAPPQEPRTDAVSPAVGTTVEPIEAPPPSRPTRSSGHGRHHSPKGSGGAAPAGTDHKT